MNFQDAVIAAEFSFRHGAENKSTKRKQSATQANLVDFVSQISAQLHELAAKYQEGEKLGSLRGLQDVLDNQTPAELAATLDRKRQSSGIAGALQWAQSYGLPKELEAESEARVKLYNDIRDNMDTLDGFKALLRGLDFSSSRRPEHVLAEMQEKLVWIFQYFMEGIATASAKDAEKGN